MKENAICIADQLATELKQIRQKKKDSIPRLSQQTGVPESTIKKFEESSAIPLVHYIKLSQHYGLNKFSAT